jgi:hypothetical protein
MQKIIIPTLKAGKRHEVVINCNQEQLDVLSRNFFDVVNFNGTLELFWDYSYIFSDDDKSYEAGKKQKDVLENLFNINL